MAGTRCVSTLSVPHQPLHLERGRDPRGPEAILWILAESSAFSCHPRFVNAINRLGLRSAVPKTILTMMNVDGLSRENVASHLQKYRLYLKKMGGFSASSRVRRGEGR